MIIVKLHGGLGNQMFQYAFGRSVSLNTNDHLLLDISKFNRPGEPRNFRLNFFKIKENYVSPVKLFGIKFQIRISNYIKIENSNIQFVKEQNFNFDESVSKVKAKIVYYDGYWQSEKYFKTINRIIRNEFTLKYSVSNQTKSVLDQIWNSNAVSIHIRRGDYISNPTTEKIHGICNLKYYYDAIDKISNVIPDPHFFIFSDDLDWVKSNLEINYPVSYMNFNGPEKDYEDLFLISQCKHHIIANSSFSWWGAWLSQNKEKVVISPRQWFQDTSINTQDLIPEDWMKI